jgi:REP element-mobilizing transposase RayT
MPRINPKKPWQISIVYCQLSVHIILGCKYRKKVIERYGRNYQKNY